MSKKNSKAKQRISKCIKSKNKKLDLSECSLSDNSPELQLLEKCTHITELSLRNNRFIKIPRLGNLVKLENLDLSNNQIQKIERLDRFVNLERLNLNDNQIQKIERLDRFINLKYLDLSN